MDDFSIYKNNIANALDFIAKRFENEGKLSKAISDAINKFGRVNSDEFKNDLYRILSYALMDEKVRAENQDSFNQLNTQENKKNEFDNIKILLVKKIVENLIKSGITDVDIIAFYIQENLKTEILKEDIFKLVATEALNY